MSPANFKCIPLLNLLRFQGGELEERVFDAKFQDFMAAAKSDLEKAQTKKAKALIYHATLSAQLSFWMPNKVVAPTSSSSAYDRKLSRQCFSSSPPAINSRSIWRSSLRISRPLAAFSRRFSSLSLVNFP
jgi:hypothetical protein